MSSQYLLPRRRLQAPPYEAADVAQGRGLALGIYLFPLLVSLDQVLDKRLVRTFLQTIEAIIAFRDRLHSLLLSELGGYLLCAQQARAGTKRLSNLLHAPKWSAQMLHAFLWHQATSRLETLEHQGVQALVVWDESVWEKPETEHMDDLCAVRSEPGVSAHPAATGLLPSSTSSGLCAWSSLAGPLAHWSEQHVRSSGSRREPVVDDTRPARQQPTSGSKGRSSCRA